MSLRAKISSIGQLLRSSKLAPAVLIVVVVIALIILAIMRFMPSPQSLNTKTSIPHRLKRSQLEAELITITPTGFEPVGIIRPKGPFILVVDNRSGLKEVAFTLTNETGNHVREVRIPQERLDWDEVVDLHPGNYVLTETNHPNWLSRIKITPQ